MSIVITCYNYAAFLPDAIESALGQTYQLIEVVVVDDGSTDDTSAVAGRYPVTLIAQTNSGLAAAGNTGIRASHGAFIVRLDADDILAPTYVEETLSALLADPTAAFAYTQLAYFGSARGSYPVEAFDAETLAERNYVHASAMMRRSAFDAVGGYGPNPRHLRCEDWDLWLSMAERGMHGVLVPKPLLNYRRHATGSMVNFNLLSFKQAAREMALAAHLQDRHPGMFQSGAMLKRLARLPRRLRRGEVSARFSVLLVLFYGLLLLRALFVRELRARRRPR